MPNCFVKNCKNRTSHVFNKNVMYYTFPQDPDLRSKWLEACQKDKEYKNKNERICEVHFKSNCIKEQMTKPRSKGIEPRVIRRLKKGSIPTEFLNLPNERHKRLYPFGIFSDSNNVEPSQKLVRSGIPTYAELVGCIKNSTKKDAIPEPTTYMISDITTDPCAVNASTTEEHVPMKIMDFGQETVRETDQERKPDNIELLLALVKELKEENTQLASKNLQLQATLKEKCDRIEDMKHDIHNSAKKIAADILHTVFTSGQVKKIVANKSRVKWTIEDITSAIALRSVNARAYNYLREVRKIPLPCVSTLRNWGRDRVSFPRNDEK